MLEPAASSGSTCVAAAAALGGGGPPEDDPERILRELLWAGKKGKRIETAAEEIAPAAQPKKKRRWRTFTSAGTEEDATPHGSPEVVAKSQPAMQPVLLLTPRRFSRSANTANLGGHNAAGTAKRLAQEAADHAERLWAEAAARADSTPQLELHLQP